MSILSRIAVDYGNLVILPLAIGYQLLCYWAGQEFCRRGKDGFFSGHVLPLIEAEIVITFVAIPLVIGIIGGLAYLFRYAVRYAARRSSRS